MLGVVGQQFWVCTVSTGLNVAFYADACPLHKFAAAIRDEWKENWMLWNNRLASSSFITRGVNLYIYIYIYGLWGYVQLIRVGFLPLLTLEQGINMKIIKGVYFTSVWLCNMVVFLHNPCAVYSRSGLAAKLRFPRLFITEPATGTGDPIFLVIVWRERHNASLRLSQSRSHGFLVWCARTARSLALRAHCRATRSKARLVSKSMHLFSFGTVPKCRRFNGTAP